MTAPRRAAQAGAWLLLGCLAPLGGAAGQPAPPIAPPPQAPAYLDRLIDGTAPAEAPPPGPAYDEQGWPRHLRLEGRYGTESFDPSRRARAGLAAQALLETPNHGLIALDATASADPREGSFSLRQRDLPLPGGWWAGHDLGVLDRPTPSSLRLPSRVSVPSTVLWGAAGQWEQPGQGLQLQAALGRSGRLVGAPTLVFRREPGQRRMLGLQTQPPRADALSSPPGWTGALVLESAEGVAPGGDAGRAERFDARSAHGMLQWQGDGWRAQAQGVRTHGGPAPSTAARQGQWIDAEWNEGPRRHGAGLYRLDEGLTWVDRPLPDAVQGAYYRGSWRTRQWSLEGSIDALQGRGSRRDDGVFATLGTRLRLGRDHTLGAGLAVRRFDRSGASGYADWRWQGPWGQTGWRVDTQRSDDTPDSLRLSWDQDWAMPLGHSLSTSLGLVRESAQRATGRPAQRLLSTAAAWALPVGAMAHLRGTLTAERSSLGAFAWGANLGATWSPAPRWTLEGQFVRLLGRSAPLASLDPLAPPPAELPPQSTRSFALVLRYELQAGSRSVPLGGRPQQGGGRVQGVVFFDANRSGSPDASEAGVPGVTLLLDNRYAVRTDAQGRFEFPFVAPGRHRLTLRADTLPLPWNPVDEGTLELEVGLRDQTSVALPVQRSP